MCMFHEYKRFSYPVNMQVCGNSLAALLPRIMRVLYTTHHNVAEPTRPAPRQTVMNGGVCAWSARARLTLPATCQTVMNGGVCAWSAQAQRKYFSHVSV